MGLFQAIKNRFSRENQDKNKRNAHDFDDEDRQRALIQRHANKIRKQKLEILNTKLRSLKQKLEEEALIEQIQDIEESLYKNKEDEEDDEDDDESMEDMVIKKVLEGVFNKQQNSNTQDLPEFENSQLPKIPQEKRTNDEKELRELSESLPGTVKGFIRKTDTQSLIRLIQLIKYESGKQ